MKKITLLFALLIALNSCSLKQTQNNLASGNYDAAIDMALSNLRSNKDKKGKQDYIYLLEEAFAKAKERDLNTINFLSKENNPNNLDKIFTTYIALNDRQEKIKPLLPLRLINEGRNALFPFDNYNDQIISSKNELSNFLYSNAKALMQTKSKVNYRLVYDDLAYLEKINPGFKDISKMMSEAQFKGTDFVFVTAKNETNMVIPTTLQNDLLDFKSYKLNDKWTVYHATKQKDVYYDYSMQINFRSILISPEQIKEREFIKERQIVDGQKKQLDANGNVVVDRQGKPILIDNIVDARVNIYEVRQFKSCQITAKVDYIDNNTKQFINTFPISSEFVFENIYATYKGNPRAAEDNYYGYFEKKIVPFPTTEQMIYDTGEDLKSKINGVITRNQFRK